MSYGLILVNYLHKEIEVDPVQMLEVEVVILRHRPCLFPGMPSYLEVSLYLSISRKGNRVFA